jgi:hypothetical protein
MKSGTTSIYNYLIQHPQIAPCRIKEPFIFAQENYPTTIEEYTRLWDLNNDIHSVAIEASTDYTKLPDVVNIPKRMSLLGVDNFRLIYMMRNPLRRIESHVRHTIKTNKEFLGIKESNKDFSLDSGLTNRHIAYSSYAYQLDEWVKFFPLKSILLLTLEELKTCPEEVLLRMCRFLNVDENFLFSGIDVQYGHIEATAGARPFWVKLEKIRILNLLVKKFVSTNIRDFLRSKVGSRYGRTILSKDEEATVIDRLSNDMKKLRDIYKVDTKKWWNI